MTESRFGPVRSYGAPGTKWPVVWRMFSPDARDVSFLTPRRVSMSLPVSPNGLSLAPAAIVEGFAVFAFVFALVLAGAIPA